MFFGCPRHEFGEEKLSYHNKEKLFTEYIIYRLLSAIYNVLVQMIKLLSPINFTDYAGHTHIINLSRKLAVDILFCYQIAR